MVVGGIVVGMGVIALGIGSVGGRGRSGGGGVIGIVIAVGGVVVSLGPLGMRVLLLLVLLSPKHIVVRVS